jgi:hypothetical protein
MPLSEFEKLKAQVTVIALNRNIRWAGFMDMIAKLKAKRLSKEEVEKIKTLCEFYEVDYDKIKPRKAKERKK